MLLKERRGYIKDLSSMNKKQEYAFRLVYRRKIENFMSISRFHEGEMRYRKNNKSALPDKDTNKKEINNRIFVLIIATLSSFLTPFMSTAVNIALPSIGREFAMNALLMSWIPTSFVLASAAFLVPFGRIADLYGRKKIFSAGIILYAISTLLAMFSMSSVQLIVFRVLQGIGSAMIFGTGMAMLISIYPPEERGKVLGINVAAVYIGLSIGPFVGGLLTEQFGWRSIFFINIPISLIIAYYMFRIKWEWIGAKDEKFDFSGSFIYIIALAVLMYGFSHLPSEIGFALTAAGITGIFIFIKWELKTAFPVLDMNLFKNNTVFTFSNLAALINYSSTAAVGFLMSLYLQYLRGFSPREAGLILVCQPIVMAAFSPLAGRLSDGIEPRIIASIGMALTAAGLGMLVFIDQSSSLVFIIFSLVVMGFGFSLFSSPNTNAVMSSIGKKFYGIASATLGTMRLTGNMLSMGIAMLVFAVFIGRVQITPEYFSAFLTSARILFAVFTVLCLAGVYFSLARGKMRN